MGSAGDGRLNMAGEWDCQPAGVGIEEVTLTGQLMLDELNVLRPPDTCSQHEHGQIRVLSALVADAALFHCKMLHSRPPSPCLGR